MPRRGWSGCFNCAGANGCPRDVGNSIRCTSSRCKRALTARNKLAKLAAEHAAEASAPIAEQLVLTDEMPNNMKVHELTAILGERCCKVNELDPTRRRSGPGKRYRQEFCVRGTFIDEDVSEDEDDDYEILPEANSFWVDKDLLVQHVGKPKVKSALKARQQEVLSVL